MKKYINYLFVGFLAYCSVGIITGIVNMTSFFQVINTNVMATGGYTFINDASKELFVPRAIALSIMGFVLVCALIFACIFIALNKSKSSKIIAILISAASLVGSFISLFLINNMYELPKYNNYHYQYKSYYYFTLQQILADAAKSLFIPIISVAVMLLIYTFISADKNQCVKETEQ